MQNLRVEAPSECTRSAGRTDRIPSTMPITTSIFLSPIFWRRSPVKASMGREKERQKAA